MPRGPFIVTVQVKEASPPGTGLATKSVQEIALGQMAAMVQASIIYSSMKPVSRLPLTKWK